MSTLITHIGTLLGIREDGKLRLRGAELRETGSLNDAWLICQDGEIKDYGPMAELPDHAGMVTIDARGGHVIPAYCDSHTHIVFAQTREGEFQDRIAGLSYEQIAQRGGGILNSVEKLRAMPEEELYEASYRRCLEIMQQGTGSIEIKSGYGLDTASELKMLRVARRLGEALPLQVKTTLLAAHAYPREFADDHAGYIDLICDEIIPHVAEEGLADYIDAFCERGYFDAQETERILEAGQKYGLRPKVHVNQFSSCGGIQSSLKYDALSVDHLEVMEGSDLEDVCQSDTIATALPACSFFIDIPYTPARDIIDSNGLLALATDYNPGSSPTGNMSFVLSLACIRMNMHPIEALNAATLNGAAAMELSDTTGSITRGKRADLIITRPMKEFALLPYRFADRMIERVVLNGRPV
ncbi:MAG: imidazolonepropionase [Flavobacteriales bacterium]|nr:imidazolonepropionase [Flavobacteriales bacterium]